MEGRARAGASVAAPWVVPTGTRAEVGAVEETAQEAAAEKAASAEGAEVMVPQPKRRPAPNGQPPQPSTCHLYYDIHFRLIDEAPPPLPPRPSPPPSPPPPSPPCLTLDIKVATGWGAHFVKWVIDGDAAAATIDYTDHATFDEVACLQPGTHTLTLRDTSELIQQGWRGATIELRARGGIVLAATTITEQDNTRVQTVSFSFSNAPPPGLPPWTPGLVSRRFRRPSHFRAHDTPTSSL